MMEKKIASNSEPIVVGATDNQPAPQKVAMCDQTFPVGGRFLLDGKIWRVEESMKESNEEMRLITNNVGDKEIRVLRSLKEDLRRNNLRLLPDDDATRAMRGESGDTHE